MQLTPQSITVPLPVCRNFKQSDSEYSIVNNTRLLWNSNRVVIPPATANTSVSEVFPVF